MAARSHMRGEDACGQLQLDVPPLSVVPTPRWVVRLALGVGEGAYKNVPLWSGAQRWARIQVPVAYDLRYKAVRHLMPNNGVSRAIVMKVADARARYAEGATGRHCRPSNATLAACTGLPVRTVQRASLALRLMGCATEILRGRQRTKTERLASWRMGDRSRGWASVWALHTPIPTVDKSRDRNGLWRPVSGNLSPHPRRGSISVEKVPFQGNLPTGNDPQDRAGHGPPTNGGATRHSTDTKPARRSRFRPVDEKGRLLALRWLSDGDTPAWAGRFTPRGWAAMLAAPAAQGWTAADINTMIREWVSVGGNYLPPQPYRPHGLLGVIFKWHGDLSDRPAAAADAQAAAHRAAEQAHTAAYIAALHAPIPAAPAHRAAARAAFVEAERRRKRTW
ncbi:repa [Mycobacteroides abscessus]|uniref:repa n=1 Tax=Mycobacteroides abscessus TaxID=36809 RepID=UPI0027DF1EE0|nr:repa [Mycobacteroides abscessus]